MSYQIIPTFMPNAGIALNQPEEFLANNLSPYSRNMEFYNQYLQTRSGLIKFDPAILSGPVLLQKVFRLSNGSLFYLFATPKDIYSYDFTTSRFDILTPVYQTGKVLFTNGSAKVYGGVEVDNCDETLGWVDGGGATVTPTRTTTPGEFQEGTAGVKLAVGAGAAAGDLLAYHDISAIDLSAQKSVGFWFKSTVALAAGDLKFVLDDTSACASPLEAINIPVIAANTWTWVNLPFVTPAALTAVISIGIKQVVDKGAMNLFIDQIVSGSWSVNTKIGDYIKLGTDNINTNATWYQVLTVDSDTSMTLTGNYAGTTAFQQLFTIRQTFTGLSTNMWFSRPFVDNSQGDVWLATNGVDCPIWYNGSGQVQFIPRGSDGQLPEGFTARYLEIYKDRVVWFYCVEGGQNNKKRIRYSGVANFQAYQGIDFQDLLDEDTEIRGACVFDDFLMVGKEREWYVGRPDPTTFVFSFAKSSTAEGLKSNGSIIIRKDYVYYYGFDKKFHRWNILRDEIISEQIFPETKDFDQNLEQYICGQDFYTKNQVRWFCPYTGATFNNYIVVYDYLYSRLNVWDCGQDQALSSMGYYILQADLYMDDVVWGEYFLDEHDGYFDDVTYLANAPVFLYGGYDGILRKCDTGRDDDGIDFVRVFRSNRNNYQLPNQFKRLWKQQFWFQQDPITSVTIKMRKDDNTSYEALAPVIALQNADKDIVKKLVTWDKEAQDFQVEISATDFFSTLGWLNYVMPKRKIQN